MKKRNSKRLENGEIQFSDKLNKKIDSVCIIRPLFELYDTKRKKEEAIYWAKETIINQLGNSLLSKKDKVLSYSPNMEGVYIVPGIWVPLREREIRKIDVRLKIININLKGLKNLKSQLTKRKNKLEKMFMHNCENSIYRKEVFPEIELFLEDEYERVYEILEEKTKFFRKEKKIVETKFEKQCAEYNKNSERSVK